MKNYNRWTCALLSAGLVSLPAIVHAEEQQLSSVMTALSTTTLSGYVDTSAQWNFGTGDVNLPAYSFGGSSKADGFNLNVVKLSLERAVAADDAWGAGYKVDLLAGPDANAFATQSLWGNGSTAGTGDFAVKQAYVALHAPVGNGLDFKMGVWDTIIGYEVFESVNNPNFTRSYGYTIEPTTHTGLLGTYKFCDVLSASFGIANTFGPQINQKAQNYSNGLGDSYAESYKAYMGGVTLTAPQNMGFLAGSTLTAVIINGLNSASPDTFTAVPQTSYYIGATMNTPVTGLKVGGSFDYAAVNADHLTAPGQSEYANAYAAYVSYQATEKLSLNVRGEYATSGNAALFLAQQVVAATATVQYDLWKNVVTRLEFRWDHAADGTSPFGSTVPGDGDQNAYELIANVAYKF